MFDVARHLLVVEADGGTEVSRHEEELHETSVGDRAKRIADGGLDVLICGAISRTLEAVLISEGVQVLSYRCGPAEDVLGAFVAGQLTDEAFLMPGCCGRRRQSRGGGRNADMPPGTLAERRSMMTNRNGTGPQGRGPGTGRGRGPCRGSSGAEPPGQGSAPRAGGGRRPGRGQARAAGRGRRAR